MSGMPNAKELVEGARATAWNAAEYLDPALSQRDPEAYKHIALLGSFTCALCDALDASVGREGDLRRENGRLREELRELREAAEDMREIQRRADRDWTQVPEHMWREAERKLDEALARREENA